MTDNWIPITDDTLPPMEEPVWLSAVADIWIGGRTMAEDGWLWFDANGDFWLDDGKWDSDRYTNDDYHPTQWMPLPLPPNAPTT